MDLNRHRFRSTWRLPVSAAELYAVLEEPGGYPRWWPQVRDVAPDPGGRQSGTVRFRSFLPYDLVVEVTRARRDPDAGVLDIGMTGDLEGRARWTVTGEGPSEARAVFDQDVVVRKPLMRRLALPGRPFFRLNHALMMRAGQRGLRAELAARGRVPNGL